MEELRVRNSFPTQLSQGDWQSLVTELNGDASDAQLMAYLLEVEEEIRKDLLFELYDATENCDWSEYYDHLTT